MVVQAEESAESATECNDPDLVNSCPPPPPPPPPPWIKWPPFRRRAFQMHFRE